MNTTAKDKKSPLKCGVCEKSHRIGIGILNEHLLEAIKASAGKLKPTFTGIEYHPYTYSGNSIISVVKPCGKTTPSLPIPFGNMGQQPHANTLEAIKTLKTDLKQYPPAIREEVRFEELTEDSRPESFEAIVADYIAKIAAVEKRIAQDTSNEGETAFVDAHNSAILAKYAEVVSAATYPNQGFRLSIGTERPTNANWTNASRSLPRIPEIKQEDRAVQVYIRGGYSSEYPARCEATTTYNVEWSEDGRVCKISGSVDVRNFRHGKVGGSMNFVYFVFVGDDNRLYVHRATATDGWYNLPPADFNGKIKRYKTAIQQGDMLFIPANGDAKDIKFEHEVSNFGEHKLEFPVLAAQGHIKVDSPISVTHRTHPTISLTPRVYRVATTKESLRIPMHTRID